LSRDNLPFILVGELILEVWSIAQLGELGMMTRAGTRHAATMVSAFFGAVELTELLVV